MNTPQGDPTTTMLDLRQVLDKNGLGELIGRDASNLRQEEWQAIDDEVIEVARPLLQAREILRPIIDTRFKGAGWTEIKSRKATDRGAAVTDMSGDPENADLRTISDVLIKAPVHHAESFIGWRNLEASRHSREPLDVSAQGDAGAVVGQREEAFVALGDSALGIDGLCNPTDRSTTAGASWSAGSGAGVKNAFADINAMSAYLDGDNTEKVTYAGRKILVVNPVEGKRLKARFEDGAGGSPLKDVMDAKLIDALWVNPQQTAGKACMFPLNKAYARWFHLQDVTTDELPARGRNTLLSTYAINTVQIRMGKAFVERTGLT
ncbi:MAG: encapsulin [Thermoplasmatota archaeon]